MSGYLGIGKSGEENDSVNAFKNVFNYGLDTSKGQQAKGSSNLSSAANYFTSLLSPGRTAATAAASPATNAIQDQADNVRRQEAVTGTSRTGGTAEANRAATAATTKNIDDVISENLYAGRKQGGQGLQSVGTSQLVNAGDLLGLGLKAEEPVLKSAVGQTNREGDFGSTLAKLALTLGGF